MERTIKLLVVSVFLSPMLAASDVLPISFDPSPDSRTMPVDRSIFIRFSEPISPGIGNVRLIDTNSGDTQIFDVKKVIITLTSHFGRPALIKPWIRWEPAI